MEPWSAERGENKRARGRTQPERSRASGTHDTRTLARSGAAEPNAASVLYWLRGASGRLVVRDGARWTPGGAGPNADPVAIGKR